MRQGNERGLKACTQREKDHGKDKQLLKSWEKDGEQINR